MFDGSCRGGRDFGLHPGDLDWDTGETCPSPPRVRVPRLGLWGEPGTVPGSILGTDSNVRRDVPRPTSLDLG